MDTHITLSPASGPSDSAPAGRQRPHGKAPVGRDRILQAAGQLFVEHGYAATTTRQISAKVGIKQPSLYYHFPHKAAMLLELLLATAQPSLMKARQLRDQEGSPLARLLELIRFDVNLLASGPSNIGSLYLLPEVSGPEFSEFRSIRTELIQVYSSLLAQTIQAGEGQVDSVPRTTALLFSIVEGVILRRADNPDLQPESTADDIELATLRILGATRPG